MKYTKEQFTIYKKESEYILWDNINEIATWYDDYSGYGLLSGNLEFGGQSYGDGNELLEHLVWMLNDGEILDENEFDYIEGIYNQERYRKQIENQEFLKA